MKKFYLLVVGSRDFTDYDLLSAKLDMFLANHRSFVIVSGGADGADSLAKRYAKEHRREYIEFPAMWDVFGNKAGYIRNLHMHQFISQFEHRGVVAFWNGSSKGTAQSFKLAQQFSNPLRVVRVDK